MRAPPSRTTRPRQTNPLWSEQCLVAGPHESTPLGDAENAQRRRLGLNSGAYRGETIDIAAILAEIAALAANAGWLPDHIPAENGIELPVWVRRRPRGRRRIYLSAGIHGDEPAGPLAVRELMRQAPWPEDTEIWLCPCLNPTGFPLNRRENAQGYDLNRQYAHLEATEARAHAGWLQRQPSFDVCLCLHEDWEAHGFYLYELNPDGRPSLAEAILQAVSRVCPIDTSPMIEGRPADRGLIRPSLDPATRPHWPEAFFLLMHQSRHSYTLEAPSDYPIDVRVDALTVAVRAVLQG